MSVYIKDMDMPIDCLACRIACEKENYGVIGRPPKCPLTEAKTGDLISRADAIEAVCGSIMYAFDVSPTKGYDIAEYALSALPSAEAVSREEYDQLEALYDAIRIYDSSAEAVQGYTEWLEKIIVMLEPVYLCEDTTDKEWCEKNCKYDSIQAECLRHLYGINKAVSAEAVQGEWIMHGEPPWYVRECSECGTK